MSRLASNLVLAFLFMPLGANADSFYTLIRYECVPASNQIIISHIGAYNEAGEAMANNKGANEWGPWKLVKIRDDGNRTEIVGIREVKRTCKLSDGIYTVSVRPSPGNYNVQGRCGAHMSAGVRISRAKRGIIDTDFEGDCHNMGPVITKVVVSAGQDTAAVTKVEWNDFYK
jgi:hypothetical protein